MILSVYAKLVIFGVVLHLIVFYSIFDIYYSSPLIQHLNPHPITSHSGPAKRLVVFSADGLRSDTFFDNPQKSPFLHSLINNNKASWGLSSSHVPTESRPGHVAIFAGFYEDVSAVTRGWKVNPVQFDSVFNRSHEAWAWGSPDIVSMFSREVAHVHNDVYPPEMEQFFDENAWKLDEWVYDRVKKMFNESSMSASLKERLNANGVILFLHFLGIDINGHSSKPHSSNYIANLVFVDSAVRNVSNLIVNYFNDNKTAFIFTADHGMTDWGSHGAGTPQEVLTPFVVWGSGVKASHFSRNINQIDLAPLISSLLGIPIPTNSIGSLPIEILNTSHKYRFQASYANLKQLLEQFTFKRKEKKSHTLSVFFKEFPELKPEALRSVEKEIQRLIKLQRFEAASQICIRLFDKVRDGIFYFHRYERTLLGTAIAATFIAWIWLIFVFSTRSNVKAIDQIPIFTPEPVACAILLSLVLILIGSGMKVTSCIYILLPFYTISVSYNICDSSLRTHLTRIHSSTLIFGITTQPVQFLTTTVRTFALVIMCIGTALFLLTSVFTQRWLLSVVLLLMSLSVHLNSDELNCANLKFWKRLWSVVCMCLAIFPLLPSVGSTPNSTACITASLLVAVSLVCLSRHRYFIHKSHAKLLHRSAQLHMFIAFIMFVNNFVVVNANSLGFLWRCLFAIQKVFCWCSIAYCFVMPLFAPPLLVIRLIIWFSSMFVPYSLLSLSYESLFLYFFFILLFVYIRLEYSSYTDQQFFCLSLSVNNSDHYRTPYDMMQVKGGPYSTQELSRALLLVLLIEIAFFGTGNIASINSFNPSFVRLFIQTFSPFIMTSLLLFKILLPFLTVSFAFVTVFRPSQLTFSRLAYIIHIITDAMAMIFFMQLTDEGSWLEIGTSISHYVISMAFSVFVFGFLHLAHTLLPLSLQYNAHNKHLI